LVFDGRSPRGLGEVMSGFALAALAVYWGYVRRIERHAQVAELAGEAAAETVEGG
jgi:hypothetical protein